MTPPPPPPQMIASDEVGCKENLCHLIIYCTFDCLCVWSKRRDRPAQRQGAVGAFLVHLSSAKPSIQRAQEIPLATALLLIPTVTLDTARTRFSQVSNLPIIVGRICVGTFFPH